MPTVIVCGTPGTGKSSLIEGIKPKLPQANYINLSKFAIDNDCTSGYDDRLGSHIIDDDKLTKRLQSVLVDSRLNIVECIHPVLLDSYDVDKVFVVRTNTTNLYDRLEARGYNKVKVTNNVEAEIFQLILDEAVENFGSDLVVELKNDQISDLEKNVALVHQAVGELLGE